MTRARHRRASLVRPSSIRRRAICFITFILISEFPRMRMKARKHMTRLLIEEGRTRDARRSLARVIYYQPASPKAYRRYLKTFLPARFPRATSRTGDGKA